MEQIGKSSPKEIKMEAVIIRADGTREVLGTIGYWHKNPIKRLIFSVKKILARR